MRLLIILLFSSFCFSQQQALLLFLDEDAPSGTDFLNGEGAFTVQGNWNLENGSTLGGGIAEINGGSISAGNIEVDFPNWSLNYRDILAEDGVTTYRVTFEARTTNGETGSLQVGRGFENYLVASVTASWQPFNVSLGARNEDWSDALVFGIINSTGTIQLRNVILITD